MTDKLELEITSLRWDERLGSKSDVPYIIVNCTFKVDPGSDVWQRAKGESEEYDYVLTVDNPEKYEKWIDTECGFGQFRYSGFGRAWVRKDPVWHYIPKFNTFWLREWVADCSVTRAAIGELEYYQKHGKLQSVYRSVDSGTILRLLRTLNAHWD
jgi:hypothetical protein